MSHPLSLPPLETAAPGATATPRSPIDGGAPVTPTAGVVGGVALSCDYLSFGCHRSFASDSDLDQHLSHPVHAQKHLMLVQSAYVALHRQFDLEKAAIEAGRIQLDQEQAAHKADVLRAQEEQRQAKSALAAVRTTAEEFANQLHNEEQTTATLKAQLDQRNGDLGTASERIVQLQQQASAANDLVVQLKAQLAATAAAASAASASVPQGGMSLDQQKELSDSHAGLKHEVVQLRHQLHAMHLHQAPPPSHSDEDWTRLVAQAQDAQRVVGEMQSERDHLRAAHAQADQAMRIAQAQASQEAQRAHQLASTNMSQANELDALRKAVKDLTDRLATAEETVANAVTAFEPPLASSASPPTDSERATWAAQKRHLETRLMKYEPFSPMSPQVSPRPAAAGGLTIAAAAGAPAYANWPTPAPPSHSVPGTPGGSARPLSPRTAALQGYTDAQQPHMLHHHQKRISFSGGGGSASPTASGGMVMSSTLATSAALLTAAAGLNLSEKRRLLQEKVTGLEAAKQAATAKLEAYLGAEVAYFEVTIDRGQLGTLIAPTPTMTNRRANSTGGSSLPPIGGAAQWAASPSSSSDSVDSSSSSHVSRSAMFIGLSVKDDSILLSGQSATSHPSMHRPPVTVGHIPGHHPGSYAYCSLNGHVYDGRARQTTSTTTTGEYAYGPSYARGDTIGVGWNVSARQVFFTRNGVHLGIAAHDVELVAFHACVAIVSETGCEGFTLNFGSRPFLWRGLALRDRHLKLDAQHFLYSAPPCVGIELDRDMVSTACLQVHPYQAPSSGGLEVVDLAAAANTAAAAADGSAGEEDEEEEQEDDGGGMAHGSEEEGVEGETARRRLRGGRPRGGPSRESNQPPPLLSAVLILPPSSSMPLPMNSFGDNTMRAFPTHVPSTLAGLPPSSSSSSSARKELIAICFSKQSLLPLLELSVTLHAPLLLQSAYPNLKAISLHAYIKDSALANFKAVSSTERVAMNDPRMSTNGTGELSLTLTAVHQAQPSRHLMIVVNGVDAAGQQTMLGVSDDILDLSSLVHARSHAPTTCPLSKDGRHLHKLINVSVTVHRVTGGRPSRKARGQRDGADSLGRPQTRSSGNGQQRELSPSSSPFPSRPGTVATTSVSSQGGRLVVDPRSPHVFEHSVESMFQTHSPSSSMRGSPSHSGTPFGFDGAANAGGTSGTLSVYGSPPSTPGAHRSMASTPTRRGVSSSFDAAASATAEGFGWSNVHTAIPGSPMRPHPPPPGSSPPAHSRTPSSTLLMRGTSSSAQLGATSGNATLDAEELELQPLTKKLSKLYHEYRKVTSRLAHLREEVAAYLEEEENALFAQPTPPTTGPQLTQQQQIAHMKRNLAAGLPQHAGLPTPALPSGGKPLRTSLLGVGPGAEAELDAFVAAGGGAYAALFHAHVLASTLPAGHRFAHLRQVTPLVQKQQARLATTWCERVKRHEEAIDTSCLFQ